MKEEWLPVVGYEGYYEVSSLGRVKSLDRIIQRKDGRTHRWKGRVLKLTKSNHGYLVVSLWREGKCKVKCVHRLVLQAFVGECPEGMEALHGDGNKVNNRVDNLRWGSSLENKLDIIRHGRHDKVNKTHCPRGHELIPGNRVKCKEAKGHRNCLACSRAQGYIQYHPELQDQRQEVADRYYEAILKETTDAPVVARSRDARTIMDRRRRAEQRNEQQ